MIYQWVSFLLPNFDLLNYIRFNENMPKILEDLPDDLQNNEVYNNILYEMYIEDFLDNYLVTRFNINKYLFDITNLVSL